MKRRWSQRSLRRIRSPTRRTSWPRTDDCSGVDSKRARSIDAAETGRELLTLEGHSGMVKSVAWSPDSRRLASADADTLHIWDATGAYAEQMAVDPRLARWRRGTLAIYGADSSVTMSARLMGVTNSRGLLIARPS